MECVTHLFSAEELEALDEKQLEILEHAIIREIRTSPEILGLLRTKFRPVYDRWASTGRPQRARTPRSR